MKKIYIVNILNKLEKNGIIWLRGNIDDYKKGEDIDLYVPSDKIVFLKNTLFDNNFSLVLENNSKIFFKYYTKEGIYILDIMKNFDYIFDLFPLVKFNDNFISMYLSNPKKYKNIFACIRYIHMLRKEKKYMNFINNHYELIVKNNFYLTYLNRNIFSSIPEKDDLLKILQKKVFFLIKFLNFKDFLLLPYGFYKKYKFHFNNGRIIALSGVDGVGKTTICNILKDMSNGKYIYMGYGDTNSIFGNYFNIKTKNLFLLILKYLIRYIENILLLLIIYYYKISGRLVILDRIPLLESAQLKKGIKYKLSTILYKYFYFIPKDIFILHENSEIIFKRKPEKTINEIKIYQDNLRKYVKKEGINVTFIKNNTINHTCSKIFNQLYK